MAGALELQERACSEGTQRDVIEADRAFHSALYHASGNSVLLEVLPTLSDRTRLLLELNTPPSENINLEAALRVLRGHTRIFETMEERDPESAVQELHQKLTRGRERLVNRTENLIVS